MMVRLSRLLSRENAQQTRLRPRVVWVACVLATVGLGAAGQGNPLIEAIKDGDLASARALIQRRVDVNAPAPDGATALHWAANRDDVRAVALLLDAGANPRLANRYGVTPLALGAVNGNATIIERLLKAGADVNGALPGGETALMTAARAGKVDAIRVLVAHGANVNAKEQLRQQTALMWAAAHGNVDAIRVLVEAGADIEARSSDSAPKEGRGEEGGAGGARANALKIRFTPLLFAVRSAHIPAAQALLNLGANVNEATADGTSALNVAITNANWEMAAFLIDRGADLNAAAQGWTALHEVARTRSPSVGQIPPPIQEGRVSSLALAEKLIKKGANVNARMTREMVAGYRFRMSRIGATPLLLAAKGVDVDLMRLLLKHGADPNIPNEKGTTPLMAAAGVDMQIQGEDSGTNEDALEAVGLLLEVNDRDINATNKNMETALHGAARRGSNPIVQLLVDKGAKLDAKEKQGLTPYHFAEGRAERVLRAQPQTVALLSKLMRERGIEVPTDNYTSSETRSK